MRISFLNYYFYNPQRHSLKFYYMCFFSYLLFWLFRFLLFRLKKESEQLKKTLSEAEQTQGYIRTLKMILIRCVTRISYKIMLWNTKSYLLHVKKWLLYNFEILKKRHFHGSIALTLIYYRNFFYVLFL